MYYYKINRYNETVQVQTEIVCHFGLIISRSDELLFVCEAVSDQLCFPLCAYLRVGFCLRVEDLITSAMTT